MEKGGLRYNDGKPQWNLVDWDALLPLVRVLEYGAKKYSADNWKKGLSYVSTCNSLMRHWICFMGGEDLDKESGLPHVGHILANALFLSYYYQFKKEFDDRYIDKNKETQQLKSETMNDATIKKLQDLSTKCAEMQQGRYILTDNELEEIEGFLAYLGFQEQQPSEDSDQLNLDL